MDGDQREPADRTANTTAEDEIKMMHDLEQAKESSLSETKSSIKQIQSSDNSAALLDPTETETSHESEPRETETVSEVVVINFVEKRQPPLPLTNRSASFPALKLMPQSQKKQQHPQPKERPALKHPLNHSMKRLTKSFHLGRQAACRRLTLMKRRWTFPKQNPSTDEEDLSSNHRRSAGNDGSLQSASSEDDYHTRMMPGPCVRHIIIKKAPSSPSILSQLEIVHVESEDTTGKFSMKTIWRKRMVQPFKRVVNLSRKIKWMPSSNQKNRSKSYDGQENDEDDDDCNEHFSVSTDLKVAAIQRSMFGTPPTSPHMDSLVIDDDCSRISLYFDESTIEMRSSDRYPYQRSNSMSIADLDAHDNMSVTSASLGVSFDEDCAQLVLKESSSSGTSPNLLNAYFRSPSQNLPPKMPSSASPIRSTPTSLNSTPTKEKVSPASSLSGTSKKQSVSPLFHQRLEKGDGGAPKKFEEVWNRIDSLERQAENKSFASARVTPSIVSIEAKHPTWNEEEGGEVRPAWSSFSHDDEEEDHMFFPKQKSPKSGLGVEVCYHGSRTPKVNVGILGPVLNASSSMDEDDEVSVPFDEPRSPNTPHENLLGACSSSSPSPSDSSYSRRGI